MKKPEKIIYSEPADYFPENIRKEYKLGEYAEEKEEDQKKKDNVTVTDGKDLMFGFKPKENNN